MKRLPSPLSFDWDEGNINKNWLKHHVHNKETEEIFFNRPLQIFPDPKHSKAEQRYVLYGITNKGRRLTVVFTYRRNIIRVISARDQNKKERNIYDKNKT